MTPTPSRRSILPILTLILLTAAAFRLWHLASIPPGLQHDEVFHAHDAFTVRQGYTPLWFTSNAGNEPLYIYLMALTTATIGDNVLGIRITAVIAGLLTIAFTYRWADLAFGRRTALIAAAFMAVTFWPVFMSRVGLRAVMLPPMSALTAWLYTRALTRRLNLSLRGRSDEGKNLVREGESSTTAPREIIQFIVAGLAMGASLYTYPAAFAIPLTIFGFTVYLALFRRDILAATWRGQIAFWLTAALTYLPLFLAITNAGGYLRVQQTAAGIDALKAGNPALILDAAWKTLAMWTTRGDPLWRYNIADRPVFGVPLAVIFLIGACGSILLAINILPALTKYRRAYAALVTTFLLFGIVPSIVTDSPPAFLRASAALPATFVAFALGFEMVMWFIGWLRNRLGAWVQYASPALIAALLIGAAATTARDYFLTWPANDEVQRVYRTDLAEVASYLRSHDAPGGVAVSTSEPHNLDPFILDYTPHGTVDDVRWFDGLNALIIPGGTQPAWIFVTGEPAPGDRLQHWYLDHLPVLAEKILPGGGLAYRLYEAPPGDAFFQQFPPPTNQRAWVSDVIVRRPNDPDGVFPIQFGDVAQLVGYSIDEHPQPGNWLSLTLFFRVTRDVDAPEPWSLFVHVLDTNDAIIAQRDMLSVPAYTWHRGDVFVQTLDVALPDDIALGIHRVEIGLYSQADGARFPVIMDGGIQRDRLMLEPVEVTP